MRHGTGEVFAAYDTSATRRLNALVLILDLEGFTAFCTKPQVDQYIPLFLNQVFSLMSRALGLDGSFDDKHLHFPVGGTLPLHIKFLGDGLLLIWKLPENPDARVAAFLDLLNHLYILRASYKDLVDECSEEFGISSLPTRIRFGIASGEVIRLQTRNPVHYEYVGFPINLASRLRNYCKRLGLIASARIGVEEDWIEPLNYKKVKTKPLSGIDTEIVIVDKNDYEALNKKERLDLFREL